MSVEVVFETHSTSEDNERGIATGWLHGCLSAVGRTQAQAMGDRRREDGLAAVFTSDLGRAVEAVAIAFAGSQVPIFHDWRLRECNFGLRNGHSASEMHRDRQRYLDLPYPAGEGWRQAVHRVGRVLEDLRRLDFGRRVLIVGHVATRWACDHSLAGVPLEQLIAEEFVWQEGWEYRLNDASNGSAAPAG